VDGSLRSNQQALTREAFHPPPSNQRRELLEVGKGVAGDLGDLKGFWGYLYKWNEQD
jgi:hypothetical protein